MNIYSNMPDYSKAKIYKIYSDAENSEVYYGSTIQAIHDRMSGHRCGYRAYLKGEGGYCYSYILFDKYGLKNVKIELIENYSCNDKSTLLKREGEFIRLNECINKNIAGRSRNEGSKIYYQNNREKKLEYDKKWRENNTEYYKKWRENNTEYDKKYRQDNREKIRENDKKYYQDNREKKLEYGKKYYQDNREKK